jgi:hypothetical protein
MDDPRAPGKRTVLGEDLGAERMPGSQSAFRGNDDRDRKERRSRHVLRATALDQAVLAAGGTEVVAVLGVMARRVAAESVDGESLAGEVAAGATGRVESCGQVGSRRDPLLHQGARSRGAAQAAEEGGRGARPHHGGVHGSAGENVRHQDEDCENQTGATLHFDLRFNFDRCYPSMRVWAGPENAPPDGAIPGEPLPEP